MRDAVIHVSSKVGFDLGQLYGDDLPFTDKPMRIGYYLVCRAEDLAVSDEQRNLIFAYMGRVVEERNQFYVHLEHGDRVVCLPTDKEVYIRSHKYPSLAKKRWAAWVGWYPIMKGWKWLFLTQYPLIFQRGSNAS